MKRLALTGLLVVAMAGMASAYGGGGFFQGSYLPVPEYSNVGRTAEITGGYGYGADRHGTRRGGFGLAIHDAASNDLIGAFGGVISGSQVRTGPLTLSLNLWSGVGYVSPAVVDSPVGFGYFLEADAEAGFALLPWFQLSVYAGMQALGSFEASSIVSSARYTPVVGSRLSWGGF
ncbi:MAG TPA: hypothetical protein VKA06_02850 [Spirochaetia bacterium]|nr:hypothetical protein [Spirochaetia bacterium]